MWPIIDFTFKKKKKNSGFFKCTNQRQKSNLNISFARQVNISRSNMKIHSKPFLILNMQILDADKE